MSHGSSLVDPTLGEVGETPVSETVSNSGSPRGSVLRSGVGGRTGQRRR